MRKIMISAVLVGLVLAGFTGCASSTGDSACTCSQGKSGGTVWCESCETGYLAGQKTSCKDCVTAAGDGRACTSCEAKTACLCSTGMSGGTVWCESCSAGYFAGTKVTCQGCYAAKTGGPACKACAR